MKKLSALALTLLLCGCMGSRMSYPENWASLPPVEKNVCPNLTGKYQAVSEPHAGYSRPCSSVGKGWYCRSLPEDLIGQKQTITQDSWVEINRTSETELRIIVGTKDVVQDSVTLKATEKQYECGEDGLTVRIGSEFMAGDGAIGVNTGFKKTFRRASDGSLIMKEETSGGGLIFLVIPVAGSSIQWWKWQPVER